MYSLTQLLAKYFQSLNDLTPSLARRIWKSAVGKCDISDLKKKSTALTSCFYVGDEVVEWGAKFEDLATTHFESAESLDPRWKTFDGGRFFDIKMSAVHLGSAFKNGPITQVFYDIAHIKHEPFFECQRKIHEHFIRGLGRPHHGDHMLIKRKHAFEGEIIGNSEWRNGSVRLGLSWFGAARNSGHSQSCGMFYVDWDDELAIARPYLSAWQSKREKFESIQSSDFFLLGSLFVLPQTTQVRQSFHFDARNPSLNVHLQNAQRAIYSPNLLSTSRQLNSLVVRDAEKIFCWNSPENSCWGISNCFDTAYFSEGQVVNLSWDKVRPAKGPGGHYLSFGDLSVSLPYGDPIIEAEIQQFFELVSQINGVVADVRDGSDC
jgi:hypothetical protein